MTALAPLILVTTGVAAVMIKLGLAQGMLQFRNPRRRCPSCGRLIDGPVCRHCTRVAP